jgi:feruloyl esterase
LKVVLIIAAAIAFSSVSSACVAQASPNCNGLRTFRVSATEIGLPTRGAEVTDAHIVPAETAPGHSAPERCLVSGRIRPFDQHAPDIEFQVALPTTWNGKALMLGGGGFDGTVPNVAGPTNNSSPEASTPLARGYAVFGSNGGHRASPVEPGFFMLNAEAYGNYRGDALKKTRDVSIAVIRFAYGKAPTRSYFIGGSSGGREALMVSGRWPDDWDGVVAMYPAIHLVTSTLGGQNMLRALAAPDAWLDPAKRLLLRQAALAACDKLDGVADGIISNVKRCQAAFNPRTALLHGVPLRCPLGKDTGDTCLSDPQLNALDQINAGVKFNFKLASGDTEQPGYNVYFQDNGVPGTTKMHQMVSWIAFGPVQPAYPVTPEMTLQSSYADNYFRYGVAGGDHAFNSLPIDPANPGQYAEQLSMLSAGEADDRNMSGFVAKGRKLILLQGTEDTITSPRMTEQYFMGLQQKLGADRVATSVRFYEVPGWGHSFSNTFLVQWDHLTALENWVERGQDPAESQVVTDGLGVPGRTRPLCMYPAWPKYKGDGDVNSAASFICTAH